MKSHGGIWDNRRLLGWFIAAVAIIGILLGGTAAVSGASGSLVGDITTLLNSLESGAGSTGLPGTTAPTLTAALSGGPANDVVSVACPISQALTLPGANDLSAVICALGVADYAYKTTYTPPSGPAVVRYTRALLAVPTPINVTGDGVPDFTGTILPGVSLSTGPGGLPVAPDLTLSIVRLPTLPVGARVTIEAVVVDPVTPDTYVGIGEDGSNVGTAGSWNATVSLISVSSSGTELGLAIRTGDAPSNLSVLGELFSGTNADDPSDISRGDINFAPVPATLTTDVTLAATSLEAKITSSVPSVVTPVVSLITPTDDQEVKATINKLPSSVDLIYNHANGHQTFTYTGSSDIDQLDATYEDIEDLTVVSAAAVTASGVPTGATFDQVGTQTTFTTTGGPISEVEVRFGQGTNVPPILPGNGAYVSYQANFVAGIGARIFDLEDLSFNDAAPYSGNLTLSQPLSQLSLLYQNGISGLDMTGSITDLPAHIALTIDLVNGVDTFDGYGAGIGQVTIAAGKRVPFFSRVDRIDATINDIPPLETFSYDDSSTSFAGSASAPLGSVTLLLSDGSDAPTVSGPYADFIDTPAEFLGYVDIDGFEDFAYAGDPTSDLVGKSGHRYPADARIPCPNGLRHVPGDGRRIHQPAAVPCRLRACH